MTFKHKNKNITGLELLEILENNVDPFTNKELTEYKGVVTKELNRLRQENV